MKTARILFIIWAFFLVLSSCKTEEKAVAERRNLMMPKKTDLRKNDKYTPSKGHKTYSTTKKKKKKR